ncbi:hypothetical protein EYF80_054894 [Liparis tanakae]|uniref:Uncharacterized protein n=1 Tax=Liparis tanakae TaxID=230148 RepID=A0A4Z2F163_9TELE|nr:hypothetical protein EYF80_054894 [Liparis tanakae]
MLTSARPVPTTASFTKPRTPMWTWKTDESVNTEGNLYLLHVGQQGFLVQIPFLPELGGGRILAAAQLHGLFYDVCKGEEEKKRRREEEKKRRREEEKKLQT